MPPHIVAGVERGGLVNALCGFCIKVFAEAKTVSKRGIKVFYNRYFSLYKQ